MHELGDEIDLAVEDLRALAHGVYPSLLSDRGLKDALRGAFLDSPLPVHLDAQGVTRHPSRSDRRTLSSRRSRNTIETRPGARRLDLADQGEALDVEVLDDGPGRTAGRSRRGLRNMGDRVDAIGGRVRNARARPRHGSSSACPSTPSRPGRDRRHRRDQPRERGVGGEPGAARARAPRGLRRPPRRCVARREEAVPRPAPSGQAPARVPALGTQRHGALDERREGQAVSSRARLRP